jgi:hypothetical protein
VFARLPTIERAFKEIASVAEQRHKEWDELDTRAHWALEHPELAEPREPIRQRTAEMRLWHHPSFDVHRSWTIFGPDRRAPADCRPLVRRATWERPGDRRRMTDPIEAITHARVLRRPGVGDDRREAVVR